ncbi:MAG: 50S ribosomal protein L19 [Cytophagales bacterium]|nr:50S ribosomal protein L19 [Cytophagales bacterium]
MSDLIKLIEAEYLSKVQENEKIDLSFKAGDNVNVYVNIKEGNKERTQLFAGTVIQRKNPNTNGETFTVRKISNGIAVERIFPVICSSIEKIEVTRRGKVRRARLYYLRDRMGKSARVKEKIVRKSK